MNSTVVCLKTSYTKAERGQKTGLVAYCLGKFKIKTKSVFLNELKRKPAQPPENQKKKKKKEKNKNEKVGAAQAAHPQVPFRVGDMPR